MNTQLDLLKREWCDRLIDAATTSVTGDFTSDQLHHLIEAPAEQNWFGVAMAKLRCSGRIIEVGRKVSVRPEANGRKITVWRFKNV